jgi:hypothetical protein
MNGIISNIFAEMITILDNFCALSNFLDETPGAALPPVGSFSIEGSFANYEGE